MVSTRQMSTAVSSSLSSHNGGPNSNSNDDAPIPPPPPPSSNTRMTVITRQSSNNSATTTTVSSFVAVTSSSRAISSPTTSGHHRGGNNNNNHNNATINSNNTNSNNDQQSNVQRIFLLDLPVEILDRIFSYVSYKKVGQMRVISKRMNQVCSSILNSNFSKLQTQLLHRFQTVKAMMPRRESARRNHPLACECDIIETCCMRLSLLQMTFGKHIERKHCCFFPGGILDEVYFVLHYIRTTPKLERPYKVTDELFDLSTMAMEYFKERIEPNLPDIAKSLYELTSKNKQSYSMKAVVELTDSSSSSSPPQSNMVLRKGIRKIKQGMKMYNNQLTALRSELRTCKRKSSEQGKQIAEQQKLLADQQKQTLEYANRLDENDRKNEEMSRKFSTLLQELNKCKTELQYWRSKSPAVQVCTSCGHKITPHVSPEEYQALVNQGIKPQDININLDDVDDSDTSSNVFSDLGLDNQSTSEFVFPDEATTAKLLAVSSANVAATATVTAATATIVSGGGVGVIGSKRRHDGTLRSTVTAAVAAATATTTSITSPVSTIIGDAGKDATITDIGNSVTSFAINHYHNGDDGGGGKNCHSSKPSNIAAGSSEGDNITTTISTDDELQQEIYNINLTFDEDLLFSNIASIVASALPPSSSLPSTSLLSSNNNSSLSSDTKKARKVQNKGSRCHNTNSKRNK